MRPPVALRLRPRLALIGLLILSLVAGCGQKGPLYLPKSNAAEASLARFNPGF